MYLSSLFILDAKGKVRSSFACFNQKIANLASFLIGCLKPLISRNYRGDVDVNVIDHFMQLLLDQENENNLVPIIQHGSHTFIFTKHTNLYRKRPTFLHLSLGLVSFNFGFN